MPFIKTLRSLMVAFICGSAALFLLTALTQGFAERRLTRALQALPDHDFTADILALQTQGHISEALDWARYVTNNPALPNQAAASNLVVQLEREQNSVWRQADRAAKGFITGAGASVEEMGGAIASDMVVYGDCRDLVIQGYYKLTGRETDAVVAALAGVGLLTELVDDVDWAPAVLKAFRKANALSQRFGEWLIAACRRSTQARAIDPALKQVFVDLKQLHERLGLAKTAAVFKHVDEAADVTALAKYADAHPCEVYRFMVTAGDDGLPLLRRVGDEPRGFERIALATCKGAPGIRALRKGGELWHITLFVRYGERALRTFRLERPQRLLHALAMRSPCARNTMWGGVILLAFVALWQVLRVFRKQPPRYA
jgi:hypothetical protein